MGSSGYQEGEDKEEDQESGQGYNQIKKRVFVW
jgi:hypothetical protein